ncbi:DUF4252 domain-containing protein [Salegentibacter sp.]|uniref:DUF4252 domain-containing protein n=1 Tax=Salegentibacter sp. TaxID=1903072 RepID=UPI0035635D6C
MKLFKFLGFPWIFVVILTSCGNEPTIQEYYVENLEESNFIALDIPASLLANNEDLDEKQKQTLESIRKVNVLAYPLKANKEKYEEEKAQLQEILKNDEYQLLMRYGSGLRKAEIYYTGEEDAVDEFILFGFDDSRGVGLARILGEDMEPKEMLNLLRSMEKGDFNLEGIKNITQMFEGEVELDIREERSK